MSSGSAAAGSHKFKRENKNRLVFQHIKYYHIIYTLTTFFYFTDIMVYICLCTLLCVHLLLLLSSFGCFLYIPLLSILLMSFYANHTTSSYARHQEQTIIL